MTRITKKTFPFFITRARMKEKRKKKMKKMRKGRRQRRTLTRKTVLIRRRRHLQRPVKRRTRNQAFVLYYRLSITVVMSYTFITHACAAPMSDRWPVVSRTRGARQLGTHAPLKCTICLSCVIVLVRVVFRKTVVGDWHFDYLSGSHLQSQVKSPCYSV